MKLDSREVKFEPRSIHDTNGRVFYWNNQVYRGISAKAAGLYLELLRSKKVSDLFELGLVETEIAPLEIEGYALVLKHHKIPKISYCTEWCGAMLKDAALLTINLNIELAQLGLELQDAHAWNILFDAYKPVFIDFSSIRPIQNSSSWYPVKEFIINVLNPLYLMANGYPAPARAKLAPYAVDPGIRDHDIINILSRKQVIKWRLDRALRRVKLRHSQNRLDKLKRLKILVEEIDLKLPGPNRGSPEHTAISINETGYNSQIQQKVIEIVERYRPNTLLDIAGNTEQYSTIAAKKFWTTISFNMNECHLQNLYHAAKKNRYNILPLLIDFVNPPPPVGSSGQYLGAVERLQSEMVLCLGILHDLVFERGLHFKEISHALSMFTEKFLLIEFTPRENINLSPKYSHAAEWYHLDELINALEKYFWSIETITLFPSPKILLLCKR